MKTLVLYRKICKLLKQRCIFILLTNIRMKNLGLKKLYYIKLRSPKTCPCLG